MKEVLIIGSGIAGMACAVRCAALGMHVTLVSPTPSERSQSVMAAGGINAVLADHEEGDSVACHIEDTLKGGAYIAGKKSVTGLCEHAEEIIHYLKSIGTVFTVDENGRPARRAFGGQSHKRTYYCGSSTGKQIVSALAMEIRRYEAAGLISRSFRRFFYSALIRDGACYGALLFNEHARGLEPVYADALVVASGGQNALFGKTTGSTLCDGYVAGRLFTQGIYLKNLEFIQYHPTTLETPQKHMLISEAARGEGGRLFYIENGRRVYFMEDKYGPRGNLMTRDIISREICKNGRDVFLDVSFLDKDVIEKRIPEVRELCMKYRGIDISEEPVPVVPSVHFFMGGIAVHLDHETNIKNLFAAGECASMYHGANRLGGNSLLAAIYGGYTAASAIADRESETGHPDFTEYAGREQQIFRKKLDTESPFPAMYIRDLLADTMKHSAGIIRTEEGIEKGLSQIDNFISAADKLKYDASVLPYVNYSLSGILPLARAVLTCAEARKESRGAHYRSDFPEGSDEFKGASLISYDNGKYRVWLDKEGEYES